MSKSDKKAQRKLEEKKTKKAERKAAEKAAEKARRKAAEKAERKAAEKAERKREKMAAAATAAEMATIETPTESAPSESGDAGAEKHPHMQHLERVGELAAIIDNPETGKKARKAAQDELDRLRAEGEKLQQQRTLAAQDAEMKKRIQKRRAERAAEPGSPERLREMQQKTADRQGVAGPDQLEAQRAEAAAALTLADVAPAAGELEQPETPVDEPVEFANPSDAPKVDFETNGLGQYKVKRPSDGRMVGYTRTTTYINVLEDTTALTKWKMRILLEGVAAVETPDADGKMEEPVTAKVRDLVHNRDVAIAKARKQDRKGKLATGQLATLVDGAWGDFKRALDQLADEVFEIGGGREAAAKGTDIHALCELYDAEGMDAVQDRLDEGLITPADFADVEAYAAACQALGLKVVATEQVIVNDDLKVAGRLDRIVLARLPEIRDPKTGEVLRPADARARRYVADIKTGRVDFGAGKIAQQIRMYAESSAYDLKTCERTSHGANRTTGLLIHLPVGTGKATVHVVDLATGARGNKLAGEVRAFRNEGRKAINLKVDLVEIATAAARAGEETE